MRRLVRMLAAILTGNAVYFSLMPYLPPRLRHEPYALDPGLLVDLVLCALAYAGLNALLRRPGSRPS